MKISTTFFILFFLGGVLLNNINHTSDSNSLRHYYKPQTVRDSMDLYLIEIKDSRNSISKSIDTLIKHKYMSESLDSLKFEKVKEIDCLINDIDLLLTEK